MAVLDTATILDQLQTRIRALSPASARGSSQPFDVTVGEAGDMRGPVHVWLTAAPGTRREVNARGCTDWTTQITVEVEYADAPAPPTGRSVYGYAVQDAEDILADLYDWSVTTDGILRFEPSPATIQPTAATIAVTRDLLIDYTRSTS